MTEQSETGAPDAADLTVAILGGTGDQGRGLAYRFGLAGHRVIIGSRSADRAKGAAAELGLEGVEGQANEQAAAAGDVVIVAVPYDGHKELLTALAGPLDGKIVIDCVNPLGFDKRGAYPLEVAEGSAAQQAAEVLPGSTVVAAFHHMSAVRLLDPEVREFAEDVLVLGEDRAAADLVQALAARIPGMRGIYAGRLRNAHQIEAFTANLIAINRRYQAHAGLRVSDV